VTALEPAHCRVRVNSSQKRLPLIVRLPQVREAQRGSPKRGMCICEIYRVSVIVDAFDEGSYSGNDRRYAADIYDALRCGNAVRAPSSATLLVRWRKNGSHILSVYSRKCLAIQTRRGHRPSLSQWPLASSKSYQKDQSGSTS
jgi:hypothetical protein